MLLVVLKILRSLDCLGESLSIRLTNLPPTLVLTFLLKGGGGGSEPDDPSSSLLFPALVVGNLELRSLWVAACPESVRVARLSASRTAQEELVSSVPFGMLAMIRDG